MDKVLGDKKAIMFFVLPALLIYAAMVIIPIGFSAFYSTVEWDGFGAKAFVGLKNYGSLFINNDDGFLQSISNTFILAGLTILIQLPVALLLALVLAKGVKGEDLFRTVFFIPVVLSGAVIAHLWRRIYDPTGGLLNGFLSAIGLEHLTRAWLGDMNTALLACSVPIIWQWIGYHMLLLYASAKSIPAELKEAAVIDGASGLQTAFKITIPLMTPVLKICFTLAMIGTLRHFDLIYVLTNGGPAHASEVPSTLMISTIFHKYQYGYGSSMAMFIVLECLLLTVLIQKFIKTQEITY